MGQELSSLSEHLRSPKAFSGSCTALYFVFCVVFCGSFVLFSFAIVLSALRFTASNHPFGIFKLLLCFLIHKTLFLHANSYVFTTGFE